MGTKEKDADMESGKEEVKTIKKKENTPAKVNPLAKFLVKAKGGEIKTKPTEMKETHQATDSFKDSPEDDIEVIEVKAPPPTTSTPLRTSPRKKVSLGRTPSTPFTPDPDRAKKLSIAKLKVKISELNMAMDKAVEEKDFLKAHETKQAIQKLEEEIKDIDADTSYVSQSLTDVSALASSADTTPKLTPKAEKEKRKSLIKEEKDKQKEEKTKQKKEKTPKKGKVPFPSDAKEDESEIVVAKEMTKEKDADMESGEKEVKTTKKKENTPAKVNPLAKFLVKAKVGEIKTKPTEMKETQATDSFKDSPE